MVQITKYAITSKILTHEKLVINRINELLDKRKEITISR